MRRRKAFMLTICYFTSGSVISCSRYRLESIDTGDAFACAWRLDTANLQVGLTVVEVSEPTYPGSNKDIEMGAIYPNSVFILTPALSTGLLMDPNTSVTSDTAPACTFTAKQFTGGEVTVAVMISVSCAQAASR